MLYFFCREAAVAVEIDGMAHEMGDNSERDRRRNDWLADRGISTLRIPAAEVLGDFEAAAALILTVCAERTPTARCAVPLPGKGRGGIGLGPFPFATKPPFDHCGAGAYRE